MSTNYSAETPRRSSSRGGRRPRRRSDGDNKSGSYSPTSRSESHSPRREPKKLTFWEKIVAFFSGKPPVEARVSKPRSESAPRTQSAAPKTEAVDKPKRATREPRETRTGMRKPESVDVTTPRVYVGNLSFDASESDLFELFSGVGTVQNAEIVSNRQTQRSKGFGFVQLQSVDEAKRAVSELHDKEYMGRKLVVSGAKAADRRDERPASAPAEEESASDPSEQPEQ